MGQDSPSEVAGGRFSKTFFSITLKHVLRSTSLSFSSLLVALRIPNRCCAVRPRFSWASGPRPLALRPRRARARARAAFCLSGGSFHLSPSQSRSLLRARCARSPSPSGGEREPATLRSPTARDRCEGESKAASQRTEKVAFLVLQRRITDGPPSTTATRNSSRRAFRGGVRSSSCPLSLSLSLACRDGSAKGRPGCRNGQSRRRRLRRRPFGGGKIECCCWACWSAGVVALPTSCMVSCRYVVVFA